MYNKAVLIGRLVRDPDMRVTLSGVTVTRFSIAVDRIRSREGKDGVTDFIRVVAWRRLAEICGEYLKKGKLVAVEGRLQFSSFEKDGDKVVSAEVIADNLQMLDRGAPQSEYQEFEPAFQDENIQSN